MDFVILTDYYYQPFPPDGELPDIPDDPDDPAAAVPDTGLSTPESDVTRRRRRRGRPSSGPRNRARTGPGPNDGIGTTAAPSDKGPRIE